jgi:hypothetical protein
MALELSKRGDLRAIFPILVGEIKRIFVTQAYATLVATMRI